MSSTSHYPSEGLTIPLTTIFTPPAWCDNLLYTYQRTSDGLSYFTRDASGPANGRTSSCYPSQYGPLRTAISHKHGIYSPGVCPSGRTGTLLSHPHTAASVSWSMCCPDGFSAILSNTWGCASTVTTPMTVAMDATSSFVVSTTIVVEDWPVFVGWQSSDLDLFTPASAPLLARGTGAVTSTQSLASSGPTAAMPSRTSAQGPHTSSALSTSSAASSRAGSSSNNNKSQGGLTAGSEAGIAIGAAVAVLAIAALIFYTMRRRRRQELTSAHDASHTGNMQRWTAMSPKEAPMYERYEAPDSSRRAELPTGWEGHEL